MLKSIIWLRLNHSAPPFASQGVSSDLLPKIPPKYLDCKPFSDGLAAVKGDRDKWGYIDQNGHEAISAKYDFAGQFSERAALVNIGWVANRGNFSDVTGRWGFIDKTGEVIVEIKYDLAAAFAEGRAAVSLIRQADTYDSNLSEDDNKRYQLQKVNTYREYGYVDKSGQEIIPLKYSVAGNFINGFSEVIFNRRKFYIDKAGTEYFEP
ncbi:MAG: WG repeat-containing protein [Pyrinomonadaceae bacterium]